MSPPASKADSMTRRGHFYNVAAANGNYGDLQTRSSVHGMNDQGPRSL